VTKTVLNIGGHLLRCFTFEVKREVVEECVLGRRQCYEKINVVDIVDDSGCLFLRMMMQ
jgi:hypothetical protein